MHAITKLAPLFCVGLAACGVSYSVERLELLDLQDPDHNGLTFRLAETEVEPSIVFERLSYPGRNFRKLGVYEKKCEGNEASKKESLKEFNADNEPSYRIVNASATANSTAHSDVVFHLNISADAFATYSHKLGIDENGLIGSGTTTLENAATALTTALIKYAGATAAKFIDPLSDEISDAPSKEMPTVKDVDPTAFCDEVRKIAGKVKAYKSEKKLPAETAYNKKIEFIEASMRASPETFKLAMGLLDEPVAAVDKKFKSLLTNLTKTPRVERYEVTAKFAPSDFEPIDNIVVEQSRWDIRRVPIPEEKNKPPLVTQEISEVLEDFVKKVQPKISILPALKDEGLVQACRLNKATCMGPKMGGYPYRWPVHAKITLEINIAPPGKDKKWVDLISSQAVIAQYGPIRRLPSKLPGSKGKLAVTYHAGQSTIKTVELGNTAVSTEPIAAAGEAIQSVLTAREKKKQAEKTAAAAALAAQNDELKREVEQLELLKKKQEIEKALGITPDE